MSWDELKRLADAIGGIDWHASKAVQNDGTESRAIYHYPDPNCCVEIIETPDSALDNAECIHNEQAWSFIAAANPQAILALIAENERLNACLKWEQNCAERIGTHGPGCESWGPAHYECLLRERDQLRAEAEVLRKDAARYRWLRSPAAWNGFQLVMEKGGDNLDAAIDAVMSREGRDER